MLASQRLKPMEHIWSPWRYQYITAASREASCVFCQLITENADGDNFILYRGSLNFVILNRFPYTGGHLMVVPYKHEASFAMLDRETTDEMMALTKQAQIALEVEYKPSGLNMGINQGAAAGAGIAGHIHLHLLPRWVGDANFLSVIGEVRVLPEDLSTTYGKLAKYFAQPETRSNP